MERKILPCHKDCPLNQVCDNTVEETLPTECVGKLKAIFDPDNKGLGYRVLRGCDHETKEAWTTVIIFVDDQATYIKEGVVYPNYESTLPGNWASLYRGPDWMINLL